MLINFLRLVLLPKLFLTGSDVVVNLDGVISLTDVNITADTALIPGEYYYLSKFEGEVVRFTTTSGTVTGSGDNAYQAATSLV